MTLTISCNGGGAIACSGPLTATSHKKTSAGKTVAITASKRKTETRTLTVAAGTYKVTGATKNVKLALDATGRKLLDRFYKLPATVKLGGTSNVTEKVTFAYTRVKSRVASAWLVSAGATRATELTVSRVPAGGRVVVICRGAGCPFARKTFPRKSSKLKLASVLGGSRLQPGTKLTLEITAPDDVAKVVVFTVRSGRRPSGTTLCLPPGAGSPRHCA